MEEKKATPSLTEEGATLPKSTDEKSETTPKKEHETDQDRKRETSVLFEPIAAGFLVVFLLLSLWFRVFPLIIIFSFLLIMTLIIIFWRKWALNNLDFKLDVSNLRVFNGDEITVNATIKNNKWLPLLWLEWELVKDDHFIWGDQEKQKYIARFLGVMPFQTVRWNFKGKAIQRGVYPIGDFVVRSGDAFRFSEKERPYSLQKTTYIYPKLRPIQVPQFNPSLQWEVKGEKGGFLEDPLLINGVRDYMAGDDFKRVNWRASAKKGELQTNIYQPIVSKQMFLFIDIKDFVIEIEKYPGDEEKQRKYEKERKERFETFLSVIASFVVAYDNQNVKIGYASNGKSYLGQEQSFILPTNSVPLILDQMAQITQTTIRNRNAPLYYIPVNVPSSVPIFIFCEKITKEHYDWYEEHRKTFSIRFYYDRSNTYSKKLLGVATAMDELLRNKENRGS